MVITMESHMLQILLVTSHEDSLSAFASALLTDGDVDLSWAESGEKALVIASNTTIDLAIAEEEVGDMTGLEFASRLLSVNPMITCATLSRLSSEDFHEASEGLGLMAQLPIKPGKEHAEDLLQRLRHLKSLTRPAKK
jgi:response regulator RpfG family c-di-GMP phosphodiesterase